MSVAAAIIVAAGSGDRMSAQVPKAFVPLGGRPLVWWSLQAMAGAGLQQVVVVTVPERRSEAEELANEAGVDAIVRPGGATRQESVGLGLAALPETVRLVAVHDAARPLVTAELVGRTMAALVAPWAAAAPAIPVVDTVKQVDGDRVVRTVDRHDLRAVQTPQVFHPDVLARAHRRQGAQAVTDDLGLVERDGGNVRLIEGDRRNFKITYPEDLAMAEALMRT